MSDFVHLRTHSSSSIKDGIMPASPAKKKKGQSIPERAAADGQEAVALTDLNLMVASVEFYASAREKGVKPILGLDSYIEPDVTQGQGAKPTRMILLAENSAGYHKILEWTSRAQVENQAAGIAAIKQSWFRDEGTDGIIALSGDMEQGEIAQAVIHEDLSEARTRSTTALAFYKQAFPDRFYLEVQRYNQPQEALQVQRLVALGRGTKIPLVATHPIQFGTPDDHYAHEVRYCINSGEVITTPGRQPRFTAEQYFKSQAEMKELFADLPEALTNTVAVARRCSQELQLGKNFLPAFDTQGLPVNDFLRKLTHDGLNARLERDFTDAVEREAKRPEYVARLEHELNVITGMDFSGYFLIVSDFIRWTKDNGMMVGPGRGSGAGSLVAYALQITDIDPLPYGLLFERFLNPERVSMPDFDIDFEKEGRDKTLAYVRAKYGPARVAQIATLGKLGGKSALNGVSRAVGVSPMTQRILSGMLPKSGPPATIAEYMSGVMEDDGKTWKVRPVTELINRYENEGEIRKIVDLAMRLEGVATNMGVHASGVVIAPEHTYDFSPMYYDPASKSEGPRTQFDGPSVEKAGLVKFDFLGLKTLDIIKDIIKAINERPEFKDKPFLDIDIPLNDPATLRNFATGQTINVFQFESEGMQRMLVDAKPDRFEDIIALVALYRPGPMDLIPSFCRRKHGEETVDYPDPRMEKVLSETYGIMVYQEQVMQMGQIIAGYSLGGADLLRRAMGKKKPEEMAKQRVMFQEGAVKNGGELGMTAEHASDLFDLMEKFAAYGFNKSHAAAYGMLSMRTMYLKTHYPVEFAVANMNFYAIEKKHDDLEATILDARASGLKILPPNINHPYTVFTPSEEGIRYGMAGLKGVNEDAVQAIIETRAAGGEFTDFFDFFRRVPKARVNKRVADALIKVGAFDSLDPDRAKLLATVPDAIKYAGKIITRQAKEAELLSKKDLPEATGGSRRRKAPAKAPTEITIPDFVTVTPWSETERLIYEHEVAGFYLSGHPFDVHARAFNGLRAATPLRDIKLVNPDNENGLRLIAGVITDVMGRDSTKNEGERWGRVTINDGEQAFQINIFSDGFQPNEAWLKPGTFMAAAVKMEHDTYNGANGVKASVDHLMTRDQLQETLMNRVHIALRVNELERLGEVIERHKEVDPTQPAVSILVNMPDEQKAGHYLKGQLPVRVKPSSALVSELQEAFGADQVIPGFHNQVNLQSKRQRKPSKYNNNNGGNNRRNGPR